MAKLFHRDATSCSFDGESYEKAEDGSFEVPDRAVAELVAHGFVTDPRLLAVGPDAALVREADEASIDAAHAKAELESAIAEGEAQTKRADALQAQNDELTARVAELEAALAAAEPKSKRK